MEKWLDATLAAVETEQPSLTKFYNSLSDEQKARFNSLRSVSRRRGDGTPDASQRAQGLVAGLAAINRVTAALDCRHRACCATPRAATRPPRSVMRSRRLNWSNCIRSPPARAGLQDIELAAISQEVTKRFYNLLAVGEAGACPRWVPQMEVKCFFSDPFISPCSRSRPCEAGVGSITGKAVLSV